MRHFTFDHILDMLALVMTLFHYLPFVCPYIVIFPYIKPIPCHFYLSILQSYFPLFLYITPKGGHVSV